MKRRIFLIATALIFTATGFPQALDAQQASRFASLALHCIGKEFPNKPAHVMDDSTEVRRPADLYPAFYGCFDWHSSVHGHWLLVKLLKEFPGMAEREDIIRQVGNNLTAKNIQAEVAYFQEASNKSFERTYGWAWLLKLAGELKEWDDPLAREWYETLKPLADQIVTMYYEFLPKLTYPNRTGEHPNTAFGLSFAWDYALTTTNATLQSMIRSRCLAYYLHDADCPASYEPGGFDFISPCLAEADMMSRVMPREEFRSWLAEFLPELGAGLPHSLFEPAVVSDSKDGKLVHLDGLNFFRAWCYFRLADKLPEYRPVLDQAAKDHLERSLPNITSGEYAGEHWLASFAVYALFSGSYF